MKQYNSQQKLAKKRFCALFRWFKGAVFSTASVQIAVPSAIETQQEESGVPDQKWVR